MVNQDNNIIRSMSCGGCARIALLAFAVLAALPSGPGAAAEEAASVIVRLSVAEPGHLFAYLVDEERFPRRDGFVRDAERDIVADGRRTVVEVRFDDVPIGTYALRAFIDQDGDGKLGRGFAGPNEPWALSWKGRPQRGVPRFSDVEFNVGPGITYMEMEVTR